MILSGLALLAALASGTEDPASQLQRALPIMGTTLHLEIHSSDRRKAIEASELAIRALEKVESRLSTWQEGSELSELNRAPLGQSLKLSPETAADIAAARACWLSTGGAFDPAVGTILRAWDVRGNGRIPNELELRSALLGAGMQLVESEGDTARRLHPRVALDEGGFGKGAGLDRASEALKSTDPEAQALLDLGGQLSIVGHGRSWELGIAHPRDRARTILRLQLDSGSVATSGNSERGLKVQERQLSHILDPRTGSPVVDFGSLTVVTFEPPQLPAKTPSRPKSLRAAANLGLRADCLSTGLYVLGPEKALAWAEARPGVEVLVLEEDGNGLRIRTTSGLVSRLSPVEEQLRVGLFTPQEKDPLPPKNMQITPLPATSSRPPRSAS